MSLPRAENPSSIADVLRELGVSVERGLDDKQVRLRQERYGANALPEEEPPKNIELIARQLKSPLVFILIGAAVLSALVGEFLDVGVILFAVLINTALGFVQERKATRALEELRTYVQLEARVRRDGHVKSIPAEELVPGDVLLIDVGDRVAADGRVVKTTELQTNEAPLTGESMPVRKQTDPLAANTIISERADMVFMGTTVVVGRGEVVVTAIGTKTHLGQTAEMVRTIHEESTPLQRQLAVLSRTLAILVLIIAVLILVIGIFEGEPIIVMMRTAAALAVAAIPEGMLVGVTVILAVGMRQILKRKGLVRRLVAAETLGSVSVICTDKTGTITEGRMQVTEIESDDAGLAHLIAALCNNATLSDHPGEQHGTPTEIALLQAGKKAGVEKSEEEGRFVRVAELPFSSSTKYMATLHEWKTGKRVILIKGAPERVLEFCEGNVTAAKERAETLGGQGLRMIAVAIKEVPVSHAALSTGDLKGCRYAGMFGLSDPVRPEAAETIEIAKTAGVRTIIITGDHPNTALAIAGRVGVTATRDRVLTGLELDALTDEAFEKRIRSIDVYARVLPVHKVRIVQMWKKIGETVAMTGDGVNDAPAIKAADIGIALGSGTEVAKQTSDVVLLDDNLATLVKAIQHGRAMFDNIRKVVLYLLSDSSSEIILITGALLLGIPLPILPAQILWINLVTDGFPHLALTFEPAERGLMSEPPRRREEPVLNREMRFLIVLIGLITSFGLLGMYLILLNRGLPIEEIRTFIFAALGIDSLLYVFSIRSFRTSIFRTKFFQNPALLIAVLLGFVFLLAPLTLPMLMEAFGFVPLSLMEWFVLVMIGIADVLLIEIGKSFFYARGPRRDPLAVPSR